MSQQVKLSDNSRGNDCSCSVHGTKKEKNVCDETDAKIDKQKDRYTNRKWSRDTFNAREQAMKLRQKKNAAMKKSNNLEKRAK